MTATACPVCSSDRWERLGKGMFDFGELRCGNCGTLRCPTCKRVVEAKTTFDLSACKCISVCRCCGAGMQHECDNVELVTFYLPASNRNCHLCGSEMSHLSLHHVQCRKKSCPGYRQTECVAAQ